MTAQKPGTIIYDGDMGGDDLWAVAALLGYQKLTSANILGITACFGNSTVEQGTRNVLDFLDYINAPRIPVYMGASEPMGNHPAIFDGAYGENGLSNAVLPSSDRQAEQQGAVEWMARQLLNAEEPITIICTGPLTNIAKVFAAHPELDKKGHEIIWLGGSKRPAGKDGAPILLDDGSYTGGNVTNHAEFNAMNDPRAANIVMGLKHTKITIMPLDATQEMVFDAKQEAFFRDVLKASPEKAEQLVRMLDNAKDLDSLKFDIDGGFIHDPQVITWMSRPDLYPAPAPISNVSFNENPDAVKLFRKTHDAGKFDGTLLQRHGEMTFNQVQEGNIYIIPGYHTLAEGVGVVADNHENHGAARFKAMAELIIIANE